MTEKREPTPEQQAEWDEVKRLLQERIDWHKAQKRARLEREERRRRRLQRLSFGLLGRSQGTPKAT
jgi:hypothetical protein